MGARLRPRAWAYATSSSEYQWSRRHPTIKSPIGRLSDSPIGVYMMQGQSSSQSYSLRPSSASITVLTTIAFCS